MHVVKPMIGYLRNEKNHVIGDRGMAYDYILAQNGVFLEAENALIRARIRVGEASVRGLEPLNERVELVHGLVPTYLLAMALIHMTQDTGKESYLAITWKDPSYILLTPPQEGSGARVTYQPLPDTVIDLHSHGTMPARFSHTDDEDDQGFRISIVAGRLDGREVELAMRISVYGQFGAISVPEIFSGPELAQPEIHFVRR